MKSASALGLGAALRHGPQPLRDAAVKLICSAVRNAGGSISGACWALEVSGRALRGWRQQMPALDLAIKGVQRERRANAHDA